MLYVEFAENFNIKEQGEIQKAHLNTKPLSIFTVFVWSKNENFSFALSTLDVTHDKSVVESTLKIILNYIEAVLPNEKEINHFRMVLLLSLEPFHFRNLTRIANERKINFS